MAEQPYNSLGQILSTGGEIALGLAYALDRPASAILMLFSRRFRLASKADEDSLADLALRGGAIGREVHLMSDEDLVPLDLLPVNRYLFSDDPIGKRSLIVSDYVRGDGTAFGQQRNIFPDQPTWNELAELLAKQLELILKKSPDKFPGLSTDNTDDATPRLLFGERAF